MTHGQLDIGPRGNNDTHMVGIAMSRGSDMRYPTEPLSYWMQIQYPLGEDPLGFDNGPL